MTLYIASILTIEIEMTRKGEIKADIDLDDPISAVIDNDDSNRCSSQGLIGSQLCNYILGQNETDYCSTKNIIDNFQKELRWQQNPVDMI